MSAIEIDVSFGPAIHNRAALSTVHRRTLETFYRHPIAHNLDRVDVLSLFSKLGSVEQGENSAVTYSIGDEHHRIAKSRGHSLLTDEVMGLRHLLTRTGWGPGTPDILPDAEAGPTSDVLVVVEEGVARLFHLDMHTPDKTGQVIRPNDPHRILRHLSHHDQGRDEEQRDAEEAIFHEAIAQALAPGGRADSRIVLIGHGAGHSNAAHRLSDYLHHHHQPHHLRVVNEISADISRLSEHQLLELGRKALTH
jgi:hypothetical protein